MNINYFIIALNRSFISVNASDVFSIRTLSVLTDVERTRGCRVHARLNTISGDVIAIVSAELLGAGAHPPLPFPSMGLKAHRSRSISDVSSFNTVSV